MIFYFISSINSIKSLTTLLQIGETLFKSLATVFSQIIDKILIK